MRQLIKQYNELMTQLEDWTYKWILPPAFRIILFGLKLTMWWALYMLARNVWTELI